MGIESILRQVDEVTWTLSQQYKRGMRVPGLVIALKELLQHVEKGAIDQLANVATLPGIYKYVIALPDIHWGYGFPIGGVAAFDSENGIISPGGVGFDINCGVRLLLTNLTIEDVRPRLKNLIERLFVNIPSGLGSRGKLRFSIREIDDICAEGAKWVVEHGYGFEDDARFIEENGSIDGADPSKVSNKAKQRGTPQLGSLGSGNHFLEIQVVDKIFDEGVASKLGFSSPGQVVVMIHTGSRGFGHQVASDYLNVMLRVAGKLDFKLPDRQLVCAYTSMREAEDYIKAMKCAVNYAFANRQFISHWTRETFEQVFGVDSEDLGIRVMYDVAHNIAKLEEHVVDGRKAKVWVHRKGATRSFGPGRPEIPLKYRGIGQPVLIPGSMGTASYVLIGTEKAMELTFGSTCHGSGRVLSRAAAKRKFTGREVVRMLGDRGIMVKPASLAVAAEEAPGSYKDVDKVTLSMHKAGASLMVVRLKPMGVVKG